MEAFEKLEVWQRSSRLCVDIYQIVAGCPDTGYKDQITRAALSVPSNIAEGYERDSVGDYVRFLKIAKGSCGELRTQLYIGREIGFLAPDATTALVREAGEISKMLQGLVQRLQSRAT
jgi:four helix bundle protein